MVLKGGQLVTKGWDSDLSNPVSYPNNTPPKATKRPIRIAGHAAPATSSGFLKARPMVDHRESSRCEKE